MANTLKFKSAKELEAKLKGFDTWLVDNGYKHKTVTRLAQYLGTNRMTLLNYRNQRQSTVDSDTADNILHVLSRAMADIEAAAEDRLYDRDSSNGAKFSLANNYGWSDRQAVDLSATAEIKYTGGNADFDLGQ